MCVCMGERSSERFVGVKGEEACGEGIKKEEGGREKGSEDAREDDGEVMDGG